MPIIVTTGAPYESDGPGRGGSGKAPEGNPSTSGAGSDLEGITRECLTQVIRRLESGFYDTPEVREHVARRIREELSS